MRPRLVVARRLAPEISPPRVRAFANQPTFASSARLRPSLPFLAMPKASHDVVRAFTSARRQWLQREAKLVVRYTLALWGIVAAGLAILFVVSEELLEWRFPTPHEWPHMARKLLRDAKKAREPDNGELNWSKAYELAQGAVMRLEGRELRGDDTAAKPPGQQDAPVDPPGRFASYDISDRPEEWRRGYVEAMMLAAKASEHVEGWVRDVTRNVVCPPEFVIGPSNPRPRPIPPGNPHAPREEDCEVAFPPADDWYLKILATKGLTPRQRLDAALEYASYAEFKRRTDEPGALYELALAEATQGVEPSSLPYNPKTLVLRDGAGPCSANVLDALTAMATYRAGEGDLPSALAMYISLLRARRSLPDAPVRVAARRPKRQSLYQQVASLVRPPAYPPPPPDGTQPPWRSRHERCHEASLHLYIGEILFATSSQSEGLAWTRDGVDLAEEQLRALGADRDSDEARKTCRECLATGLDNWSTMVSRLARAAEADKKRGSSASVLSFWARARDADKAADRWAAEEAVVQERTRRTKELMEDVRPPTMGLISYFQA